MGYLKLRWIWLLSIMLIPLSACATDPRWDDHDYQPSPYYSNQYNPVTIEIIDDRGRSFNKHQHRKDYKTHRAYVEARKGERYKLRVRNNTNKRIAVVIAVDGRNIITGKKSHLRNTERMYVLEPYKTSVYKGWRTGKNKVNRFYFTNAGDSYAAAWGDHSAMGVIAAAVYEEKEEYRPNTNYYSKSAPQAKARRYSPGTADEAAGTGYGREEHSASIRVNFRPKPNYAAKYFYKYEWRETLCKHNVIRCHPEYYDRSDDNRFWPYNRDGRGPYAPPPPPDYRWR